MKYCDVREGLRSQNLLRSSLSIFSLRKDDKFAILKMFCHNLLTDILLDGMCSDRIRRKGFEFLY